jgi:predicted nuclease of restriction endonuclease-like RecB superfamily
MVDATKCPSCGKPKKAWFKLCYECNEKEKQKPTCEVCGVEVPEGHFLCKTHWQERQDEKKDLNKLKYVKSRKEQEFKEKFEGKYYFNSQRVKSKSELLICYFLEANHVQFQYEPQMDIEGEIRPDFVLHDDKGNLVILEHFGLDDQEYQRKKKEKIAKYKKLCEKQDNFYCEFTDENDMYNLKDNLGKKLNNTPLKKSIMEIMLGVLEWDWD